MDDLDFLSSDSVNNKVQGALGYKPKQSRTTDANLGNIRPIGSNTGFNQIETREQGIKDIDNNLLAYGKKHGINTLRGVISRWAPESENDVNAYVNTVSKRLSLGPDEKIDLNDAAVRHLISAGIMLQEKGPKSIYRIQQQKQPQTQQQAQQPTDDLDPLKYLSGANVDLAVQGAMKETAPAQPKPKQKQTTIQDFGGKVQKFAIENAPTKEEFEQQSMLAPLSKAYVGINRPLQTPEDNINLIKSAGADVAAKGERMVRGLGNVIMHPSETFKQIYEHPGETLASVAKGILYNPTLNPLALKPNVGAVENLATKATKLEAAKGFPEPKASPFKSSGATTDINAQFNAKKPTQQNVGAMQTAHEAQVVNELQSASPELQQKYANVNPSHVDVDALQTHKQFDKFGIQPTEGELHQDLTKMSDEWNSRAKPGNEELLKRFEERHPKLIEGFNTIKEKVAPDVYEQDPVKLASMPLEKMKADYVGEQAKIKDLYQKANEASGSAQSPIDVGELQANIAHALKSKQRTRYVPQRLKDDLDEAISKGHLTPEEYENFRTDTATIARTSRDPLESQAAHIIREQLENVPVKDEFSQYKPLYDEARKAVKELKDKEKNPAYKAAISDTRTQEEIEAGIPHPAANTFIAKHYGATTPQVNIERMLEIIGRDSPEHQALNAAKINEFKLNSGVKNDAGNVSQATLNKIVHHQYASNLPVMLGSEALKDLQDLADVARKTEHIRGGPGFANTSNTAVVSGRQQAIENAKDVAKTFAEAKINLATGGFGGTLGRKWYKGNKEARELAAQEALRQQELQKKLHPKATRLSDIGKD